MKNNQNIIKVVAAVLWVNVIASPFVLSLCCEGNVVVNIIGLVYGVIAWEAGKRWTPKWMVDVLKELFREEDECSGHNSETPAYKENA